MSSSPRRDRRLIGLVAVLLALSVGWKLAVKPDTTDDLKRALPLLLAEAGFDVGFGDDQVDGFPIVRARNASCALRVMKVSYYGADHDTILGMRAATERLGFVYRGRVYAAQPIWPVVADQIWMRALRSLGAVAHTPPVLAVLWSEGCDPAPLDWARLG